MKATTLKQSETLIKLGVDEKTADIFYYARLCDESGIMFEEPQLDMFIRDDKWPKTELIGWSLEALTSLLPIVKTEKHTYQPVLHKISYYNKDAFYCAYESENSEDTTTLNSYISENAIDAVFNVLVWILKNKKRIEMPSETFEKMKIEFQKNLKTAN